MCVPTSGTLELEELAREAYYGQYGGNATTYPITPPIFLYDLVNGGNSAGSGMNYPTVNRNCVPNPIDNGGGGGSGGGGGGGGSSLTSYSSSTNGVYLQACNPDGTVRSLSETYYHTGSGSTPVAGDYVYSNNSSSPTPLVDGYCNINSTSGNGNRLVIKVANSGLVQEEYPEFC